MSYAGVFCFGVDSAFLNVLRSLKLNSANSVTTFELLLVGEILLSPDGTERGCILGDILFNFLVLNIRLPTLLALLL